MNSLILTLALLMLTVSPAQYRECQDRALFAGQVTTALHRGLSTNEIKKRVIAVIGKFNQEEEIDRLLLFIDVVSSWGTGISPESSSTKALRECLTEVET